jgi:putative flippase GtrA
MIISTVAHAAGRVGVNPKEAERFLKFAVVGLIGAIVDFGTLNILLWLLLFMFPTVKEQVLVGIASTFAFFAAVSSNFTWNRYWTYPDSRTKSMRRQFAQFVLVNVIGYIIRTPLVIMLSVPLAVFATTVFGLTGHAATVAGANLALAMAVIVVMFWNFFVNRYWTYNDVA